MPEGTEDQLFEDLKRAYRRGGLAWCTADDFSGLLSRMGTNPGAATESDVANARRAYKLAIESVTDAVAPSHDARGRAIPTGDFHGAQAVRLFLLSEKQPPSKKSARESLGNYNTVAKAERKILRRAVAKVSAQIPSRQPPGTCSSHSILGSPRSVPQLTHSHACQGPPTQCAGWRAHSCKAIGRKLVLFNRASHPLISAVRVDGEP